MNNKRVTLYILITFLVAVFTKSGNFSFINTDNGLSNRLVFSIEKDRKGFIWFATRSGIDRFDGKSIKNYVVRGERDEFNRNISTLLRDSSGTIWGACTINDIFEYDKVNDNFRHVISLNDLNNNAEIRINDLFFDSRNLLWICTQNGLYFYRPEENILHSVETYSDKNINYICERGANSYYVAVDSSLKFFQLRENFAAQERKVEGLEGFSSNIACLYFDAKRRMLYIGGYTEGLFCYDEAKQSLSKVNLGVAYTEITSIQAGKDDDVMVATNGAGVFCLDAETRALKELMRMKPDDYNCLQSNSVYDILVNDDNSLWFATYPNGVSVYRQNQPTFRLLTHSRFNTETLANNQVNDVLEDSQGDLWFATDEGISCYLTKTKEWVNYFNTDTNSGNNLNRVFLSLCEVSPGEIYAGGNSTGLYSISKATRKTIYHDPTEYSPCTLSNSFIRGLYSEGGGILWSGGAFCLKRLNLYDKTQKMYPQIKEVTLIRPFKEHQLLVGTVSGLYHLDTQSDEVKQLPPFFKGANILSLLPVGDSLIYIGTDGMGFFQYDWSRDSIKQYTLENSSLISNVIFQILPNKNGDLILGSDKGIVSFSPQREYFTNWTREHGLLSDNFNADAGIIEKNGYLLMGTANGVIAVNPEELKPMLYHSSLVFTGIEINSSRAVIDQNSGKSEYKVIADVDTKKEVTLEYIENSFVITFLSVNFDYPSDVIYSWRMLGLHENWDIPMSQQRVQYTNLRPGNYVFQLQARSKENGEVIAHRELVIEILPPWWMKWWAYLFYLLIVILLFGSVLKLITDLKDRRLSQKKVRFFIHTAHDLRTPLTLIKAPIEEVYHSGKLNNDDKENLAVALRNTNVLFRLVSNLLTFERAEQNSLQVNYVFLDIDHYIHNLYDYYKSYAKNKSIDFKLIANFENEVIEIDAEKLDIILRNLLSNAMKYTPDGGKVILSVINETNQWTVEIADNGIGIPKKDQSKLFNRFHRARNAINSTISGSGVGLLLVKRLTTTLGGKVSFNSIEGMGTTFVVTFNKVHGKAKAKAETIDFSKQDIIYGAPRQEKTEEYSNDKPTVIIAEDNDELRFFLMRSLRQHYNVFQASDGMRALELMREVIPDIVVSDIMMPNLRGDELCRRIKNDVNTSHIPVILLTALSEKEDMLSGLSAGADEYISKPFDVGMLQARIRSMIDNRKRLQQYFAKRMEVNLFTSTPALSVSNSEVLTPQAELAGESISEPNSQEKEFIAKVEHIMEKNLSNTDYNIDSVCQDVGMSRTAFYHKMKSLTGQTPSDYLRLMRMNQAALLLKSGKYSVAEVSLMAGFSDLKHFRTIFKKQFGLNPGEYRG